MIDDIYRQILNLNAQKNVKTHSNHKQENGDFRFYEEFGGLPLRTSDSVKIDKTLIHNYINGGIRMKKKMTDWEELIDMFMFPENYYEKDINNNYVLDPETNEKINNAKRLCDLNWVDIFSDAISIPHTIEIYKNLDITELDHIRLGGVEKYDEIVLLVNGEDKAVGKLHISKKIEKNLGEVFFLKAYKEELNLDDLGSSKFNLIFKNGSSYYRLAANIVVKDLEETNTHLCLDFGTSNTTAGAFLSDKYVSNISINANETSTQSIKLNAVNHIKFIDENIEDNTYFYKSIVPTMVYIEDCSDPKNIIYSFGFRASNRIEEDNYCPNASCFMEIKRWNSNLEQEEEIYDRNGNKARVTRKSIVENFLLYVISTAENQCKCKFKNIHISVPVKLKSKILSVYDEILQEHGYILETSHAIDEGIAVLYSIIDNKIKDRETYDKEQKALIIDCGGGTSDLASCKYNITKDDDDIINLKIQTEYMNGDVNFGGNNLTFRIMQFMKIQYASILKTKKQINIDELIKQAPSDIFSFIETGFEEEGVKTDVVQNYDKLYSVLNEKYEKAEQVIPTKFKNYENAEQEEYRRVKNNFYFLWKLAEEMKKEFFKSSSISRCTFKKTQDDHETDLHVKLVKDWRLSAVTDDGSWKTIDYPDITFTDKQISKLLIGDIYFLVQKFVGKLYEDDTLTGYKIKLSGQSTKIDSFMDSLKEFIAGRALHGTVKSQENKGDEDAQNLKFLCLDGAIKYLYALEKSLIEVNLTNENRNIPVKVYSRTAEGKEKLFFEQGSDWNQTPQRAVITDGGSELDFILKEAENISEKHLSYVYSDLKFEESNIEKVKKDSNGTVSQEIVDKLTAGRKYVLVCLNKENWGFDVLPIYRTDSAKIYTAKKKFYSFEVDVLQKSFFDGLI